LLVMSTLQNASTVNAERKRTYRSRLSNDPTALRDIDGKRVDGRSTWGRRRRDLIRSLTADVGKLRTVTERDRVLIGNVSALIVRTEQLQAGIVHGLDGDPDVLVRLTGLTARLLSALGLDTGATQPEETTLAEILAHGVPEGNTP
jgi:hypothetical protein